MSDLKIVDARLKGVSRTQTKTLFTMLSITSLLGKRVNRRFGCGLVAGELWRILGRKLADPGKETLGVRPGQNINPS
jgi:hypothetical protein